MIFAMAPRLTSNAHLASLFKDLFVDASEMKRFIRTRIVTLDVGDSLPADTVSVEIMADFIALSLEKHGLITSELFEELTKIRPRKAESIQSIKSKCEACDECRDVELVRGSKRLVSAVFIAAAMLMCYGVIRSQDGDRSQDGEVIANEVSQDVANQVAPQKFIRIDPETEESLLLTVVSRQDGRHWKVTVSKHRISRLAARDIFLATTLNGLTEGRAFWDDEYKLCQGLKCFDSETIGEIGLEPVPVYIRRWQHNGGGSVGAIGVNRKTPSSSSPIESVDDPLANIDR